MGALLAGCGEFESLGSSSGGTGSSGSRHELPGLRSGLDGIFGGDPAGRVGLGIRIQEDFGYRSMFHFLFIEVLGNHANSDI